MDGPHGVQLNHMDESHQVPNCTTLDVIEEVMALQQASHGKARYEKPRAVGSFSCRSLFFH